MRVRFEGEDMASRPLPLLEIETSEGIQLDSVTSVLDRVLRPSETTLLAMETAFRNRDLGGPGHTRENVRQREDRRQSFPQRQRAQYHQPPPPSEPRPPARPLNSYMDVDAPKVTTLLTLKLHLPIPIIVIKSK